MGCINLISAVSPNTHRIRWLRELVPFEFRASSHVFSALAGFFLLALAANLLRRKRIAWALTMVLLSISIVTHLLKGLDFEESSLAALLLIQLWLMRKTFTARSDRPSIAQGVRVLIGALAFTLAYGTLGFYLLDRYYSTNFDLGSAVTQTLSMFFTSDNAGLTPTRRFGEFFANSIYVIGTVTLGYALLMLLRPVLQRQGATEAEREQAERIVVQHGRSSLARYALLVDKVYYFSPSGQSVVAYVAKGRGAIALGDPIGPAADFIETLSGFRQFCDQNDWQPAFYQTSGEHLSLYQSAGFRVLKIGEEATVDLTTFTLKGKASQNFRTAINKFTKLNYEVEFQKPPVAPSLIQELYEVSNEWLHKMQGSEKRFSLGWFDEAYLKTCEIIVVRSPEGQVVAFANVVPGYQLNEVTIDLMRHRQEIVPGTMDFLFVSMLQHFKEEGYDGFTLGLSALSGVGQDPEPPRIEKGLNYLYEHLNQFYNFKSLHRFKEKFNPRWEPRYLVYPSLTALPDVVIALIRADSGDRLLDYFRPGS
jgi:phosphatidylglycerol lysyltransferase